MTPREETPLEGFGRYELSPIGVGLSDRESLLGDREILVR